MPIRTRRWNDPIEALRQRVHGGETITLLCSSACERESRCHRSLLREMIEEPPQGGNMAETTPTA